MFLLQQGHQVQAVSNGSLYDASIAVHTKINSMRKYILYSYIFISISFIYHSVNEQYLSKLLPAIKFQSSYVNKG